MPRPSGHPSSMHSGRSGTISKEKLQGTGVFQDFLKKLQRELAIETGIIERLYTWDRGVTEILIKQGIDASLIAYRGSVRRDEADHIKNLIDDQLSIIEGLFSYVKGEQPLAEHFIRGLQAQFTSHQDSTEALTTGGDVIRVPLEKGTYKTLPNNPRRSDGEIHEYYPPEFTQEEMQCLIRWYHENEGRLPVEVEAAWLHHRFTRIHPFQDGNGRIARTLASLVFLKVGLFPLVIRNARHAGVYRCARGRGSGRLETTGCNVCETLRDDKKNRYCRPSAWNSKYNRIGMPIRSSVLRWKY